MTVDVSSTKPTLVMLSLYPFDSKLLSRLARYLRASSASVMAAWCSVLALINAVWALFRDLDAVSFQRSADANRAFAVSIAAFDAEESCLEELRIELFLGNSEEDWNDGKSETRRFAVLEDRRLPPSA